MGIFDDEYILNNLKIIEQTDKIVFLVDPEAEGIKYIRDRYKMQGVLFVQIIDIKHKNFRKTLEKAIIEGSVIFVEIDGLDVPYFL